MTRRCRRRPSVDGDGARPAEGGGTGGRTAAVARRRRPGTSNVAPPSTHKYMELNNNPRSLRSSWDRKSRTFLESCRETTPSGIALVERESQAGGEAARPAWYNINCTRKMPMRCNERIKNIIFWMKNIGTPKLESHVNLLPYPKFALSDLCHQVIAESMKSIKVYICQLGEFCLKNMPLQLALSFWWTLDSSLSKFHKCKHMIFCSCLQNHNTEILLTTIWIIFYIAHV